MAVLSPHLHASERIEVNQILGELARSMRTRWCCSITRALSGSWSMRCRRRASPRSRA